MHCAASTVPTQCRCSNWYHHSFSTVSTWDVEQWVHNVLIRLSPQTMPEWQCTGTPHHLQHLVLKSRSAEDSKHMLCKAFLKTPEGGSETDEGLVNTKMPPNILLVWSSPVLLFNNMLSVAKDVTGHKKKKVWIIWFQHVFASLI